MVLLLLHSNHHGTLCDQIIARGCGPRAELREMILKKIQLIPHEIGVARGYSWLGGVKGRCVNSSSSTGDSNLKLKELGQY